MDPEYLALLQNGDFLRLAEERMEKQAIKSKKPLYQLRDKTGAPYCDILCGGCSKEASRIEEYMQCGLCRAVKYCSKKCQTHDWKHGGNAPWSFKTTLDGTKHTHKKLCPVFKAANEEWHNSRDCGVSLRKYFKWAD